MYDLVMIFAGGYDSTGELGEDTILRLKKGLQIWRENPSASILVTGGVHHPYKESVISHDMRCWLLKRGVPKNLILIEDESYDTWTNLINSFKIIRGFVCKHLCLVSNEMHLQRIRFMLRIMRITKPWLRRVRIFSEPSSHSSPVSSIGIEILAWFVLFLIPRRLKRFLWRRRSPYQHLR
jgi:uncharacterized SAM-binding protein YcdF (DUF218 family)